MSNPYEVLGVADGAGLRETEQAYQKLKSLYSEDSLATYALLTDEQRQLKLAAIEDAFRCVVARHLAPSPAVAAAATDDEPRHAAPADAESAPGAFLRWLREERGLSLREVAERTKIGAGKLDAIEQQRFDLLPPPVYLRGFVFEYARCIGYFDPRQLAETYLRLHPERDKES